VEIAFTFLVVRRPLSAQTGSNKWYIDSKTEKIPSLSPGRGTLQINEKAPSSLK